MAFVHGKDAEVAMGSFAITGYLRGVEDGAEVELADVTVLGDEGHRFVPGLDTGTLSFDGVFDNTVAATGQDATVEALKQAASASVITVAPAGFALGNRVSSCEARLNNYAIASPVTDAVGFQAGWQTDGQVDKGVALSALASVSATANGTGVDNGAASTNGAVGWLHVPVNTRDGSITVKVQHSTDNSVFTDLITFTVVSASTITSERVAVTGTVNRYTRVQWTVAGSTGAATMVAGVCRR